MADFGPGDGHLMSGVTAVPGTGGRLLQMLEEFAASLDEWPGALHQLSEAQLGAVVATMLQIATRAESVATLATADAVGRGTVAASTSTGAPGWVAAQAVGVDPGAARRVGSVATACVDPRNRVVVEALGSGAAGLPAATAALREVPRILPVLPGADRDDLLRRYLSLSQFGTRTLRDLSTRIIGEYAPEQLVRDEDAQQECESVFWADLPSGLTRFVAELSGGHAAVVKHALHALSAPVATSDVRPDGVSDAPAERDRRTPAKRRADALVELAQTAARVLDQGRSHASGNVAGSAKVVVTMDYRTLLDGWSRARESDARSRTLLPGVGRTAHGDLLDAGTVRQLACDADLIPAVLGSASEPLDVGRTRRLFSGGLRTAIIHRDQGCTFPGCDRPPDWCDAHHVRPWWDGGATSVDNAALLCPRHHTIVHRDLLTARVDACGVTWDLTPGLMPRQAAA